MFKVAKIMYKIAKNRSFQNIAHSSQTICLKLAKYLWKKYQYALTELKFD